MKTMKLTATQRAILDELHTLGRNGGLTGNVARTVFGLRASSDRVRRPCLVLARAGLAVRHPDNDQRWFITDAGRAALFGGRGGETKPNE